jgi:hypothetical protein
MKLASATQPSKPPKATGIPIKGWQQWRDFGSEMPCQFISIVIWPILTVSDGEAACTVNETVTGGGGGGGGGVPAVEELPPPHEEMVRIKNTAAIGKSAAVVRFRA